MISRSVMHFNLFDNKLYVNYMTLAHPAGRASVIL